VLLQACAVNGPKSDQKTRSRARACVRNVAVVPLLKKTERANTGTCVTVILYGTFAQRRFGRSIRKSSKIRRGRAIKGRACPWRKRNGFVAGSEEAFPPRG